MSRKKEVKSAELELDMTPMIDIVFLLIIFFMTVTELTKMDNVAGIQLPIADQAYVDATKDPDKIVINVASVKNPDGSVVFGSKPKIYFKNKLVPDIASLKPFLHKAAMRKMGDVGEGLVASDQAIVIRADENVQFHYIQRVMAECAMEKLYKVSLVAMQVQN